jgi:hypothetical protein
MPDGAEPGDGVDGHLTVIAPDGTGVDLWQASVNHTTRIITYNIGNLVDVAGDGTGGGGTAAGFPAIAGQVTPAELEAGEINHALFITCWVGADPADTSFGYGTVAGTGGVDGSSVYPADSGDAYDSEGAPYTDGYSFPPMGCWIRINLTESQVNALSIPTWKKAILHALRVYGGFFGDTGAAGFGVWQFQSAQMYTSLGFSDPYLAYANAHATGEDISDSGGNKIFDPNDGIDWANILEVVLPPNVEQVDKSGAMSGTGSMAGSKAATVDKSRALSGTGTLAGVKDVVRLVDKTGSALSGTGVLSVVKTPLVSKAGTATAVGVLLGTSGLGTPGLDPPTGLSATASTGQVALDWDDVAGAVGYRVYRNP